MAHEDAGHYGAKHPGAKIDKAIADAIAGKEKEGRITCVAAHAIGGGACQFLRSLFAG